MATKIPMRTFLWIGMAVSLALAGGVSYFASAHPDGLEWAAHKIGILESVEEVDPTWQSAPMPDYTTPGVDEESHLSTMVAGLVGTLVMFGAGCGLGLMLRKRRPPGTLPTSGEVSQGAAA
jgi:hypothetical protein